MAAPLSGIGSQQIPLSQPFQPGGSDHSREVRNQNQVPRENELQAKDAATAKSQNSNTSRKEEHFANLNDKPQQQNQVRDRGSVVDIIV